ncbi:MAG: hypothetical protein V4440_00360 [Pseudomonadota bacterium]
MAKGDKISGSGSFSDSFGRKPVKEKFSVNEAKDLPLYMRSSSYGNIKPLESGAFKGSPVQHNDQVMKNKSDYTQRGDK